MTRELNRHLMANLGAVWVGLHFHYEIRGLLDGGGFSPHPRFLADDQCINCERLDERTYRQLERHHAGGIPSWKYKNGLSDIFLWRR